MRILLLVLYFLTNFVYAEGSAIKAGNGNEYQVFDCGCSAESGVPGNPTLNPDARKEADALFEKTNKLKDEKNISEARKVAQLGIDKGYVMFYEEMASIELNEVAAKGLQPITTDIPGREWLTKGVEKGSNSCAADLAMSFNNLYIKTKNRENIKDSYFFTYLVRQSGFWVGEAYDEDWKKLNKQITDKEKTEVTTKAQAWMKQHNWPEITK